MIDEAIQELIDNDPFNTFFGAKSIEYQVLETVTSRLIDHIPDDFPMKLNDNYIGLADDVAPSNYGYDSVIYNKNKKGILQEDIYLIQLESFYPTLIKNLLVQNLITSYDDFYHGSGDLPITFNDYKKVFLYLMFDPSMRYRETDITRYYVNVFYKYIATSVSIFLEGIRKKFKEKFDYVFINVDDIYFEKDPKGVQAFFETFGIFSEKLIEVDYLYLEIGGHGALEYIKGDIHLAKPFSDENDIQRIGNMIITKERDKTIDSIFK